MIRTLTKTLARIVLAEEMDHLQHQRNAAVAARDQVRNDEGELIRAIAEQRDEAFENANQAESALEQSRAVVADLESRLVQAQTRFAEVVKERDEATAKAARYFKEAEQAKADMEGAKHAMGSHIDAHEEIRMELEACRRANERLRHGTMIEGDYVCPNELRALEAEKERDTVITRFLNESAQWERRAEEAEQERDAALLCANGSDGAYFAGKHWREIASAALGRKVAASEAFDEVRDEVVIVRSEHDDLIEADAALRQLRASLGGPKLADRVARNPDGTVSAVSLVEEIVSDPRNVLVSSGFVHAPDPRVNDTTPGTASSAVRTMPFPVVLTPTVATTPCGCIACLDDREVGHLRGMVLCATCGNKRCPKANDHGNECTGSNEPGQKGSAYE